MPMRVQQAPLRLALSASVCTTNAGVGADEAEVTNDTPIAYWQKLGSIPSAPLEARIATSTTATSKLLVVVEV